MPKLTTRHSGFTLVELSIVLVIIGLITGGVLVGRDLIRAAELGSITKESSIYSTAVNAFYNKYNALPGDFKKAESFWGTAADCGDSLPDDGTGQATCNGNGDGRILYMTNNEAAEFWRQLRSAGLVTDVKPYVDSPANGADIYPRSKAGGSLQWGPYYFDPLNDGTFTYNTLQLSNPESPDNWDEYVNVEHRGLRAEEAWQVDSKTDDGMPGSGNVRVSMCDTLTATASVAGGDYPITTNDLCYNFNIFNLTP